jgi:hypothetical protein
MARNSAELHRREDDAHMISFGILQDMFANIAADTDWDMNGPMLWGYFFVDRSREKLESVVPELEQEGYRLVDIHVPDLGEGEEEYFLLHVEKEEIHSPESLHERNRLLGAFSDRYGLDRYDGMDVGPIKQ